VDIDRRTPHRHRRTRKETPMSAQTPYLEVDAMGVFPTLLLVLVLVFAALGVLAHVAFV
jgi:hypothetical protein